MLLGRLICRHRAVATNGISLAGMRCSRSLETSTYEGEGKTHAKVLNKFSEDSLVMIDAVSNMGFRLNTGLRLLGPSIVFPRSFLSWNISSLEEVNEKSLALFTALAPKLDILIFGYGDHKILPENIRSLFLDIRTKHGIACEVLPTEKAVPTFNFLVLERRYVAGALIPPVNVQMYKDDDFFKQQYRQDLLDERD